MKKQVIILSVLLSLIILIVFIVCFVVISQRANGEEEDGPGETAAVTEAPTEKPTEPPTEPLTGFAEEDGVRRFYIYGVLQINTVVGNEEDGYFFVDQTGAVREDYCDGVEVDGVEWIIIEGSAYKVKTESDKCLYAAAKDVAECTDPSMSREEKLKACFDYIRTKYAEGVLHKPAYSPENKDWYIVYAGDMFFKGKGDCYSFGAAYAYMARAIGYTESYACNSVGHGWAEVEERTYDPEWSMHSKNYSYYAMKYDDPCDVPYAKALSVGKGYKRVQIEINAE